MRVNKTEYYPSEAVKVVTGYTKHDLKDLIDKNLIPGHTSEELKAEDPNLKSIKDDLYFTADEINTIRDYKKSNAYIPPGKPPVPVESKPEASSPLGTFLSLEEVAEQTGYKATTLANYLSLGKIPGQLIDGKSCFTPDQVKEILIYKENTARGPYKKTEKSIPPLNERIEVEGDAQDSLPDLKPEDTELKSPVCMPEPVITDTTLNGVYVEEIKEEANTDKNSERVQVKPPKNMSAVLKKRYNCVKKLAGLKGVSITEYLLDIAEPVIQEKREHLKALLK